MNSACCHSQSAGKFFSLLARLSRRRFEKRGFERSQQQLLEGLAEVGYEGATLLEIGCGVGHLHQSLLEQGAATAAGVDLAAGMLTEARHGADARGLSGRVDYFEGDFIELDDEIPGADVCLLDKVVCCYPDAAGLVGKSLAKAGSAYALTIPRDRWMVRAANRMWNALLWLVRSDFRTYVHDPDTIDQWIVAAGFNRRFEGRTVAWLTRVYARG